MIFIGGLKICGYDVTLFEIPIHSARNRNLEVPVYFLKPKQEYTVIKIEKDKWV
jgi:hypothetical protein